MERNMADPQDSEASRDSLAESITGSLKELNLLKNMPDEAVVDLENICRWESYGDGELIFDRTDTSNEVYFITKGRVRVVGHAKSGQEVAFIDLGVGSISASCPRSTMHRVRRRYIPWKTPCSP